MIRAAVGRAAAVAQLAAALMLLVLAIRFGEGRTATRWHNRYNQCSSDYRFLRRAVGEEVEAHSTT